MTYDAGCSVEATALTLITSLSGAAENHLGTTDADLWRRCSVVAAIR